MPPSRRRPPLPTPPTPARRPRVAGLRRPESPESADTEPTTGEPVDTQSTVAVDEPTVTEQTTVDSPVADAAPPANTEAVAAEQVPAEEKPKPRPRPTGKAKETATPLAESVTPIGTRRRPRPVDESEPDVEPDVDEVPAAEQTEAPQLYAAFPASDAPDVVIAAPRGRAPWLLPAVLALVAVILGGFATWFALESSQANGSSVPSNTALTDNARTAEVNGQITSAINTTFSYNYTDIGKTEKAAQGLLTDTALCQYNALFKVIQQQAPSQKLVLTTTVTNSGVESLQGDSARVLLVVDQSDTRTAANQPVLSQASLAVNAVRQNGKWKISYIDIFNGNGTQGCPK
jgi:Mce-associated membrane protein